MIGTGILSAIVNLLVYLSFFTFPLGLRSQVVLLLVPLESHESDDQYGYPAGKDKSESSAKHSSDGLCCDIEESPDNIRTNSHYGFRNRCAVSVLARKCVDAWLINADLLVHHTCTLWILGDVNISFNVAGLEFDGFTCGL